MRAVGLFYDANSSVLASVCKTLREYSCRQESALHDCDIARTAPTTYSFLPGTPISRKGTKASLTLSGVSAAEPPNPRAREIIQKELFSTERLVSCVSVGKAKEAKKKKQPTFFCVTGELCNAC